MGAGAFLAIGLVAWTSPPPPVQLRPDVQTPRRQIELGDVVDISRLPQDLQSSAASLTLAVMPSGEIQTSFAASRLVERARALLPALGPWLSTAGAATVVVRLKTVAPLFQKPTIVPNSTSCVRLVAPIAAGSIANTGDFAPTSCGGAESPAAWEYDVSAHAARATRNLEAGQIVASAPRFAIPDVRPGEKLYAQARVGPVVVEREVEAVQSAALGHRLFVRAADNQVFSVTLARADP